MRLLDLQRRRRDCLSIVTEAARTLDLLSWGGSGKMGSAVFLSSRMIVSGPEDDAWGWWICSARLASAEHLRD